MKAQPSREGRTTHECDIVVLGVKREIKQERMQGRNREREDRSQTGRGKGLQKKVVKSLAACSLERERSSDRSRDRRKTVG